MLVLPCLARKGAPLAAHDSVFVVFDGRLGMPDRRTTIGRRTHGLKCNRHAGQLAHVHETLAWRAKDAVGSRVVFCFWFTASLVLACGTTVQQLIRA